MYIKTFHKSASAIQNPNLTLTYGWHAAKMKWGDGVEKLAKLRPVFDQFGTVTAGNASQTSDGAAFVMVVSERMLKELNVEPIARLKNSSHRQIPYNTTCGLIGIGEQLRFQN